MLIYVLGSLKYVAFYALANIYTYTIHAWNYLFIALYSRFTLALFCWLCVLYEVILIVSPVTYFNVYLLSCRRLFKPACLPACLDK